MTHIVSKNYSEIQVGAHYGVWPTDVSGLDYRKERKKNNYEELVRPPKKLIMIKFHAKILVGAHHGVWPTDVSSLSYRKGLARY